MEFLDSHLLSIITFLPLASGLALLALSALSTFFGGDGLSAPFWRTAALSITAVDFLLAVHLFVTFGATTTGYQFVEHRPWIADYGIHYFVGIDGISLLLVVFTTFLMPIVLLASWTDITRSIRSFVFFMLFLETAMIGAFVSLNLFLFYLFWELMLIPMYFIIGIWGGPRRVYAAVKFFLFTMFGSLLMLLAMLVVYYQSWEQTGVFNFDLVSAPMSAVPALLDSVIPPGGAEGVEWWRTQTWLFAAFALAFAIKVPLVPFHTWLPDAHVEAPTAGSVVLAAVLLKMGAYGFLRFGLPLFPLAAIEFAPWIVGLSLVGILYGSLVAMVQADIKKLVAYSSVAHLGFVMLGLFAFGPHSFSEHGVNGSVLQMINHGLSTGALFLLVGMLYERRHTRMIDDFGGVAKPMPVFAACFGIVMLSSIGLPMLNGFVGEFLILLGTFMIHDLFVGVLATLGVVLSAAYMLWMVRRVLFGPVVHAENRRLIDLGLREKLVMAALIVPIFWIGLYPATLLRRIEPSVIALRNQMQARGAFTPAPVAELAEASGSEPDEKATP